MNKLATIVPIFGMSAAVILGVGCAGGSARYDVVITPDAALRAEKTPPSIAVDIVAVPEGEAGQWRDMTMSSFWAPESRLRKGKEGRIKQFVFGPGNIGAQTLSRDDAIWKKWPGGEKGTLFVLGRLPGGGGQDRPGETDGRRVEFPLEQSRWDEGTLRVTLARARLIAEGTPKPEKH